MLNPIKDNRIVSDQTFAVRLLSFIQGVQVADASSEEEKEYIESVASRLLIYQNKTVEKNSGEDEYLKRIDALSRVPNYKTFVTEDGFEWDAFTPYFALYSCMADPQLDETILTQNSKGIKLNPKRKYFKTVENCGAYIQYNAKRYSLKDLNEQQKQVK